MNKFLRLLALVLVLAAGAQSASAIHSLPGGLPACYTGMSQTASSDPSWTYCCDCVDDFGNVLHLFYDFTGTGHLTRYLSPIQP